MKFTIEGYAFTISDRHQPGELLTPATADALNSLRVRNIQNQWLRRVRNAIHNSKSSILSPEELSNLQSEISAYAASYQFTPPTRRQSISHLDLEIEIVAKEFADKDARRLDWTSLGANPEMVEEYKSRPDVQVEARKRLSDSKSIIDKTLETL